MKQVTEKNPPFSFNNPRMKRKRLLMFYSDNCEPCVAMEPLVTTLEKEQNLKVRRLEVWYNQVNKGLLEKYAGLSTVPFFYNEANGKKISGETDYETLKNWALGSKND